MDNMYLEKIEKADDVTIKKTTKKEYDVFYCFISRKFYVSEKIYVNFEQKGGITRVGCYTSYNGFYYDENGEESEIPRYGFYVSILQLAGISEGLHPQTLTEAFNVLQYAKTLKDITEEARTI